MTNRAIVVYEQQNADQNSQTAGSQPHPALAPV
jgi:hypothetical protein